MTRWESFLEQVTGSDLSSGLSLIFLFVLSVLVVFLLELVLRFLGHRLQWLSQKTSFQWDDYVAELLLGVKWWFLWPWVFFILYESLHLGFGGAFWVKAILIVLTTTQVGVFGFLAINRWRKNYVERLKTEDPSKAAGVDLVSKILQMLLVLIVALLALDNLGVDVKSLIAGLGIGGIAIALAAQNILGDLLASISIIFDKPFVIGDFITVGNEQGTVEHIGIKTTRIRAISGEELVFSNKDLLESRIHNYKRMQKRRISHVIGLPYNTPTETLRQMPEILKSIISRYSHLEFQRAYFREFGESSLNLELVYYVHHQDWQFATECIHRVLSDIFEELPKRGIDFPFPTRTLHVASWPTSPAPVSASANQSAQELSPG